MIVYDWINHLNIGMSQSARVCEHRTLTFVSVFEWESCVFIKMIDNLVYRGTVLNFTEESMLRIYWEFNANNNNTFSREKVK